MSIPVNSYKWFNAWDFIEEQKSKAKLRIVVEISGGLVQDVYCSDPQADFITIDWDSEGCDLNDPRVVEVGQQAAFITQPEVYPLDKLAGTDIEKALNNWRN